MSTIRYALESFSPFNTVCPGCGAKDNFSYLCSYSRALVIYDAGVQSHRLTIPRYLCGSCGCTHAVLPAVLIPYGSYSLFFIMAVLKEYFSRFILNVTVTGICSKYQISVSTLYEWKALYLKYKDLWLGALGSLTVPAQEFSETYPFCPDKLSKFFRRFGFSFMQRRNTSVSSVP